MTTKQPQRARIADDEESLRFVIRRLLEHDGCEVDEAENGAEAVEKAGEHAYDIYVCDIKMPRLTGIEVLRKIRRMQPDAIVVMMTAFGSQKLAVEALQSGAYDYFTKPFEVEELRIVLRRALERQALLRKVRHLESKIHSGVGFGKLTSRSDAMKRVYDLVRRVSEHDVTVLLSGESGVGKEVIAQAIHDSSAGAAGIFVKVNCAAIPEPLLESELFGHEKGSFTGAVAAKPGKFEVADGGSILLDEIGEMPLALQAKLLRMIQEKQVERVGSTSPRSIDLRIMAATNRDLAKMVKEQRFREDLFFRLNVLPIHVPPLRERISDLPELIEHFIENFNRTSKKQIVSVSSEAMNCLEDYKWPGNVRELQNVIQRAIIMTSGQYITPDALPTQIRGGHPADASLRLVGRPETAGDIQVALSDILVGTLSGQIDRVVAREEKHLICLALKEVNNHRQDTADLLGISRKSLHNKMQKYGLLKKSDEE